MEKSIHKKLTQRHEQLLKLGRVLAAIDESGLSYKTYYRALAGGDEVRADTVIRILQCQSAMIEKTQLELEAL